MKSIIVSVFIVGAILAATAPSLAQQPAASILGATVRAKGFACLSPKRVDPYYEQDQTSEYNWLVTCESGRYWVTFFGGRNQRVRRLY